MNTNQRLISFDLKAEFGFLKKPDINDGIYLTYNILHKPALLGILGAIAGMEGNKENGKFPQYYKRLMHYNDKLQPIDGLESIKIAIQPLDSDKGNFTKEIVKYNNSIGFASREAGGNLIITEQILVQPSYRCFLLLNISNNDEKLLYDYILSYNAVFIPYLGKNDFSAWWTNAKEYKTETKFDFESNFKIASIFVKSEAVSNYVVKAVGRDARSNIQSFIYFEKLPIDFDHKLYQYSYNDFVYSNAIFSKDMNFSDQGEFYRISSNEIIQLF